MKAYHPEQRAVVCRILTFAGWLDETFHAPLRMGFIEFLDREVSMFRLTDVLLPGQSERHAFFALQKSAIVGVAPPEGEPVAVTLPAGARSVHRVSWLLGSGGVVDGLVELLENVRMSDYLTHHQGFTALTSCTIVARGGDGEQSVEPFALFALQATRAIGVSEVSEP